MQPNDGRVVSKFIVQALRGEPVTVYGNGDQTRSFCFVSDIVDGLLRLMDAPDDVTGPINIGNPSEFAILELAKLVIAKTGTKSEIVFRPLPQDDPVRRRPDVSLAKATLGWEPVISLENGLDRIIDYFIDLFGTRG